MISVICEEFHCPPDVAAKQDWKTVRAIMEYRAMTQAKQLHNTDPTRMTLGQMELWKEMIELTEAAENG